MPSARRDAPGVSIAVSGHYAAGVVCLTHQLERRVSGQAQALALMSPIVSAGWNGHLIFLDTPPGASAEIRAAFQPSDIVISQPLHPT